MKAIKSSTRQLLQKQIVALDAKIRRNRFMASLHINKRIELVKTLKNS